MRKPVKVVAAALLAMALVVPSSTVFASKANPVRADIIPVIYANKTSYGHSISGITQVGCYTPSVVSVKLTAVKYLTGASVMNASSKRGVDISGVILNTSQTGYKGTITVFGWHEIQSNGKKAHSVTSTVR
ncbi:MAG: hypothetical protein FWF71_01190 [Actinomycetia bacterium]|nr:hypothetical protein [Actinomycetes bacterium]